MEHPEEIDPEDIAPDADEDGDTELAEELRPLVHEGEIVSDNVDKPDPITNGGDA